MLDAHLIERAIAGVPLACDVLWDTATGQGCAVATLLRAAGISPRRLIAFDRGWLAKKAVRRDVGGRSYDEQLLRSFRPEFARYGITRASELEAISGANDGAEPEQRCEAVVAMCQRLATVERAA